MLIKLKLTSKEHKKVSKCDNKIIVNYCFSFENKAYCRHQAHLKETNLITTPNKIISLLKN